MLANVMPAAILKTIGNGERVAHADASSVQTATVTWGLTAMRTMSASAVASALDVVVRMPKAASFERTASTGSETVMFDAGVVAVLRRPRTMAVAMFPPPMKASLHDGNGGIVRVRPS
jgi:hypothetical protein